MGIYKENNILYKSKNDEQLVGIFQDGDVGAFEELMNRYKQKIVNYIYNFTGDRDEAEDIAQLSFIKFYEKKDSFNYSVKFSTWFYTIAINNAKNRIKEMNRYSAVQTEDITDIEQMKFALVSDYNENDYESDESEAEEIRPEDFENAFSKLKNEFKEAALLRYKQGLEYEEISEILQIPVGTVKSRINRARVQLKESLKRFR